MCVQCSVPFQREHWRESRRVRCGVAGPYCSSSCAAQARNADAVAVVDLVCIRCGVPFQRRFGAENYRIKRGASGPYCSTSCASRQDDPRQSQEPAPIPGARWLQLTKGKFALVDEDRFNELSLRAWRWCSDGKSTGHAGSGDSESFVSLHHAVLGVDRETVVDHRNNDGLDCRRENLRVADRQGNGANRKKCVGQPGRTFTSQYKGVINRAAHISPGAPPWTARIRVDGHLIHLGRYPTEHEAAVAYDTAAIQHFGEFARTNFPRSQAS